MNSKDFEQMNLAKRASSKVVLDKTKPIIMMLDGRSFSKYTSDKFNKPFCQNFTSIMNRVAEYLCKNIQHAKLAYVQSDEISIYIEPCTEETQPWFGARLDKMCSVAASMASTVFLSTYLKSTLGKDLLNDSKFFSAVEILNIIDTHGNPTFDCKVWNVDTHEEVLDWFSFRQQDCARNAITMWASSFCAHKELLNKDTKERKSLAEKKCRKSYEEAVPDQWRNGRYIRKYRINHPGYFRTEYKAKSLTEDIREHLKRSVITKEIIL